MAEIFHRCNECRYFDYYGDDRPVCRKRNIIIKHRQYGRMVCSEPPQTPTTMKPNETIERLKKYFSIAELVGRDAAERYKPFGDLAWAFFDLRLLEVLLWLREGINVPLVCNTAKLQERGLRTNISATVQAKTGKGQMYCSAHCLGKGVDLSSGKMSANDIRRWIRTHIADCPHPIRLEDDRSAPTWVHIDVMNVTALPVVEFSAK